MRRRHLLTLAILLLLCAPSRAAGQLVLGQIDISDNASRLFGKVTFVSPQHIICDSGCGSSATADGTAFVAGATNVSLIGAAFDDALADVASGKYAAPRITAKRGLHVNLRTNAGVEIPFPAALGQALASASWPVILPAATITTLTPPAAITGYATSTIQTDRTQKSQITDGVRDGTVKAASTLPAATDTAVVVTTRDTATTKYEVSDAGTIVMTSATALNAAHTIAIANLASVNFITANDAGITGGSVVFEASTDSGVSYHQIFGWSQLGYFDKGVTYPVNVNQVTWDFPTASYTHFRVRLSTAVTGIGNVYLVLRASSAAAFTPVMATASKGATAPALVTSTAEGADHQALDAQLYAGGVAATIKAASTLAASSDTAVVVTQRDAVRSTVAGTIVANLGQVTLDTTGLNTAIVSIIGTWVGTIHFQAEGGDTNYAYVWATALDTINCSADIVTTTANAVWQVNVAGMKTLRVIATPWTSGTATVTISGSTAAKSLRNTPCLGGSNAMIGHVTTDAGSTITTVSAVTAITNALPAGTNRIGSVRPVDSADADLTSAKAAQTSRAVGVQEFKDAGRTAKSFYANNVAAGTTTTETLITLTQSSGTAATSSAASYTITNGKTLRIQALLVGSRGHATATIQSTVFNVRLNAGGACIVSSTPILFGAQSATAAVASAWDRVIVPIPDGYEIAGNGTIAICISAAATYTTNAPTWSVNLVAYEY